MNIQTSNNIQNTQRVSSSVLLGREEGREGKKGESLVALCQKESNKLNVTNLQMSTVPTLLSLTHCSVRCFSDVLFLAQLLANVFSFSVFIPKEKKSIFYIFL